MWQHRFKTLPFVKFCELSECYDFYVTQKIVLVVEDFDDIRDAMRILIEEIHGWKVIEATDGLEALEKANQHLPDLILMDMAMPAFDGIYATRQIRSVPNLRKIPIIAVTSYTSEFKKIAIATGCDRVIEKPTLCKEFDQLIEDLMQSDNSPN